MKNTWIHTLHKHWQSIALLSFLLAFGQIGISQTLTVNILSDTIYYCEGTGGTILQTDITGGQAPYDINWTPSITLNNDSIEDPSADPVLNTFYTIVVTDALAASQSDSVLVIVLPTPSSDFVWVDSVCASPVGPLPSFTGTAGNNALFYWQLNSGPPIIGTTPVFPGNIDISIPGLYSLCLWVEENGCTSDTTCLNLMSFSAPTITLDQVFDQCFTGNLFSFSLQDTSGIDSINWTFGSSASLSTSTNLNPPAIQYLTPGFKNISVVAYNGGCVSNIDSASFFVSFPEVDIIADTIACSGDSLIFEGIDVSSTAGNIISWQWNFSNGASLTNQTVQSSFATAGNYSVALNAIDNFGCSAIADFQFLIEETPMVDFSYSINDCNEISFSNASSLGTYDWDFGDGTTSTSTNPVHIYQSPGIYFVMLTVSGTCQSASMPLPVTILPACVWPGDANNDLIANNIDLLAIGVAFGSNGPVRNDSSLLWEGQGADNWNDTLLGGINYAYVDTDGNGIVNDDDSLAITLNYGQTHNKKPEKFGTGTTLYFDTTQVPGPVMVGSNFEIPVMLGTAIDPADSVYGIAFTICYTKDMIDSASAHLRTTNSWLGTDLLRIEKDFYLDGELDGGICRKDHIGFSNHGQIAVADFVMIDDIAKQAIYDTLRLGFKDVVLIRADGSTIPVTGIPTKVIVFQDELISGIDPRLSEPQLSLFPNPVNDQLTIKLSQTLRCSAELIDSRGRSVYRQSEFIGQSIIQTSSLLPGIYLLTITHAGGILSKKVQIQR